MHFSLRKFCQFLLLPLFAVGAFTQTSRAQAITVKAGIPVYVYPGETAPVKRAVTDLLRDLNTVFGQPSALVNNIPASGPVIIITTGNLYKGPLVSGWEAHQVYTHKGRIVLNGADTRGTIYAVYTFSELMLGVKPLWFWMAEKPAHKNQVLIPAGFKKVIASPYVKYRTWLPNDTDLLSPWQSLSAENYEAFYETMLRLKLNTLEGVTPDGRSFKPPYKVGKAATVAQQRGLAVTGHHPNIFGSTYAHWAMYWEQVKHQQPPALTIANKEALREYWAYHIDLAQQNNLEVVWQLGFRGNRDIPFWEFFPDAPADMPGRAKVIDEMIKMQIALLKEKTKNEHPAMRLTLYNEMSNMVADGLYKLPDEPSLIRNFVAARRDHFPAQDIRTYQFKGEPVGYYMNFQFTSTGSHLAQAEGPRKMEQNFRMVDSLSGHKLIFTVVNAGNMREHLLELSANAAMMWNFKGFNADAFLNSFSATCYGRQAGAEIAILYRDFFNSYWQQKKGDIPGFDRQYIFQDMRYGRALETLLNDLEKGQYKANPFDNHPLDDPSKGSAGYFRVIAADNGAADELEATLKGTAASIAKLQSITSRADVLYANLKEGKTFFDDNLRGQAYLMLHLNRALNYMVQACQSKDDKKAMGRFVEQSLSAVQLAQQRLRESEHPPFTNWYANDTKFGMKVIEQRIAKLQAKLAQ